MQANLIKYKKQKEWTGYSLHERTDGLWQYEQSSQIQGTISGRVSVLKPPEWWHVDNVDDMESMYYNPVASRAEMLIWHGTEVRCLQRGACVN